MGLRSIACWTIVIATASAVACTTTGATDVDDTTLGQTSSSSGAAQSTSGSGESGLDGSSDGSSGEADATGMPSPIECDLFVDDCPRGFKCAAYGDQPGQWVGARCIEIADQPVALGETCTVSGDAMSGEDNCPAHATCWFVDPTTLQGECVARCTSDTADPGCNLPCGTLCTVSTELSPPLCLPGCDPLQQDCANGRTCIAADTHFVCARDESGRAGAMGDTCTSVAACDPGLFCLSNLAWPDCEGPGGCCAPACDLDAADACSGTPDGVSCLPWYGRGAAPPTTECTPFDRIGVCGI